MTGTSAIVMADTFLPIFAIPPIDVEGRGSGPSLAIARSSMLPIVPLVFGAS
jgi:hypothetical protein